MKEWVKESQHPPSWNEVNFSYLVLQTRGELFIYIKVEKFILPGKWIQTEGKHWLLNHNSSPLGGDTCPSCRRLRTKDKASWGDNQEGLPLLSVHFAPVDGQPCNKISHHVQEQTQPHQTKTLQVGTGGILYMRILLNLVVLSISILPSWGPSLTH